MTPIPPFLDWQLLLVLFVLFGTAVGMICYIIGHSHGHACGYEAGCADENTRLKPRIIQAKREAANIARTLCMAELHRGDEKAREFWKTLPKDSPR